MKLLLALTLLAAIPGPEAAEQTHREVTEIRENVRVISCSTSVC